MPYRQLTDHCFHAGADPNGAVRLKMDQAEGELAGALAALKAGQDPSAAALLALAKKRDDLPAIQALGENIRSRFAHVVVIGSGGSALSGRMLCCLKPAASPAMHFLDNVDPDAINAVIGKIDPAATHFIVISKSGTTVETLAQFFTLLALMHRTVGAARAAAHFTVIAMAFDSPLRRAAQSAGMLILDHPADIGGRFSVLTAVGLLPAAIAGLDLAALRDGAQTVVGQLLQAARPKDVPSCTGAALQYAFLKNGRPLTVMLPYAARLAGFSDWYRQSWSESLGKAGKGSTPIRALGTTDQHSQLQLYLGGPRDKLFHLIVLDRAGTGQPVEAPDFPDLDYLRGKTTGDIMAAEQRATLETLVRHGCPVRVVALDALSERELGALFMHFTLEIIFMSHLLKVNPFDQPAVEEGKRLAREYLLKGDL